MEGWKPGRKQRRKNGRDRGKCFSPSKLRQLFRTKNRYANLYSNRVEMFLIFLLKKVINRFKFSNMLINLQVKGSSVLKIAKSMDRYEETMF
jgi:hypothetical protein